MEQRPESLQLLEANIRKDTKDPAAAGNMERTPGVQEGKPRVIKWNEMLCEA